MQKLEAEEQRLTRLTDAAEGKIAEAPWIHLSAVRAAIPQNAYYVDIVHFRVFNLHGKGEEQKWQKSRYAAWLVPPAGQGDVRIVDLGEADVVQQAIQKVRGAIERSDLIRVQGEQEAERFCVRIVWPLSQWVLTPIRGCSPSGRQQNSVKP